MSANLKWHGEAARARILAETTRRLHACCILVVNRARVLLSIDGTGGEAKRDQHGRFIKGTGKARKYGSQPSAPGEPPHKQHGHLRRSVAWEVVGLVGRVGSNLKTALYLELGTRKMKPRPWLRRALAECRGQIVAILSRPMK